MAFAQTMARAAKEYLEILATVSSNVIRLREELRGTFEIITPKWLPQGLRNTVEDPTETIQQLGAFCLKLLEQVKALEANNSTLSQAWRAETRNKLKLTTEKQALCATLKNYEEKVNTGEELMEDLLPKLVSTQEKLENTVKDCEEKLSAKMKEVETLRLQLDESQNENSNLREELMNKDTEIAKLSGEKDKLLDTMNASEEKLSATIKEEQKSLQQSGKSINENRTLKEGNKSESAEIKKLASVKQELQRRVRQSEEFVMIETTEKQAKLVQKLQESLTELTSLREKQTSQIAEIETLKYEKEELENEQEKLINKVKDCEALVGAQNDEEQKVKEQVKELQPENIKVRDVCDAKRGDLEMLANENEGLHRRVKDCEAVIKSEAMQVQNVKQWMLRHGKTSRFSCIHSSVVSVSVCIVEFFCEEFFSLIRINFS